MKYKIFLFYLCFITCFSLNQPIFFAYAHQDATFYRVTENGVIMYKDEALLSPLFELTATYFVKQIDTVSPTILKVESNGIVGFIDTTSLEKVNGIPQAPYIDASFDMNGTANAVLFSEPNNASSFIGTIPFNATSITFYGKTCGQEMLPNMGTIWYYCKYTSFEQGVITGYIYEPLTKNLTAVSPNTEVFEEPVTNTSVSPIEKIIAPEIQNDNSIFLIITISIIAFFVLFLALHKGKSKRRKTMKSTNQIDSIQKHYLEFNEKDDF